MKGSAGILQISVQKIKQKGGLLDENYQKL